MIGEAIESMQWDNWADRLRDNPEKFITPGNPAVNRAVSNVGLCEPCPDYKNVKAIWKYVHENVEYQNTPQWKTPQMTLDSGVGDCEDFAFLLASMFPHAGIEESKIIAGNLKYPDGKQLEHAWNEVNGKTVDATGTPEVVSGLDYEPVITFRVVSND